MQFISIFVIAREETVKAVLQRLQMVDLRVPLPGFGLNRSRIGENKTMCNKMVYDKICMYCKCNDQVGECERL